MRESRGFGRRREPVVPKVHKVELPEKNIKLRVILIAVFLLIGVIALTIFVSSILKKEAGWREIEVTDKTTGFSQEFVMQYHLGVLDDATAEYRAITSLYTEYGNFFYALFDRYAGYENIVNVYQINRAPNTVLKVDPVLYDALGAMEASEARYLYLGPVYDEYVSLMQCENDAYAAARDPRRSEDARAYIEMLLSYCTDPAMISLELLGDNQICLHVADEYLALAQAYEFEALIDFGWLRNAFIIDAVADTLASSGFVLGNIASYDGFTRNLDTIGDEDYAYNYFDRYQNSICHAAVLTYRGDLAVVDLRTFALREQDLTRTYTYADGTAATLYIDPADGQYRHALHGLLAYSDTNSCAEIALTVAPMFIADALPDDAAATLQGKDIAMVTATDALITNSGDNLTLVPGTLYQNAQFAYQYQSTAGK
jgi:hypothetical protein